ncbi:ABC transporter ATP-binding protein [Nonomuraea sp. CA-141351]|uniref:ABC transporter ATP-binding protein n=1 Tax=Nonomuraea sp. CA-141351 TaxID=3239996 RepID=UPI003D8E86EE
MSARLEVRDLTVHAGRPGQAPPILDRVSLTLDPGEVLALVGESGSGKSMTAHSVLRMLPTGLHMHAEALRLGELDLLAASSRALDGVRGRRISMLYQQPKHMLDPTATVGSQVAEPLRRHLGMSRQAARRRVVELLAAVGIPDPERRAGDHPHQMSGGMAQRVMIAMALATHPDVLIADEPTTALDVTVEAQILRLIAALQAETGMSVLFISHDVTTVASIADRIAVMYAGRIVEDGPAAEVITAAEHPYTQALLRCSTLQTDDTGHLHAIPGNAISARAVSRGCRFRPRCAVAAGDAELGSHCDSEEPDLACCGTHRNSRCWVTIDARGQVPA